MKKKTVRTKLKKTTKKKKDDHASNAIVYL